jgi:hypothetical protein
MGCADGGKALRKIESMIANVPRKVSHWGDVPCIDWDGQLSPRGYGVVTVRPKTYRVHRLAFKSFHGRFPQNFACHYCDNPKCLNPHHLFDGTPRQNLMDAISKGRFPPTRAKAAKRGRIDSGRICDLRAAGYSFQRIADWLGISRPAAGIAWKRANA